jgi:hypothetical protein
MPRRRRNKSRSDVTAKRRFRPRLNFDLTWLKPPPWVVVKRSGIALAWLLAVGGLGATWVRGVPNLQAFASHRGFVEPADITIRFTEPPAWMKGDLADALMRTAQANIGGDPLRRDDLVAVRENLLRTGWFNSISQVRRVDADLVEITADFVRPYTIIRDDDGSHLVDMQSRLLPKSYGPGARTQFHFIAIVGAHFDRPQRTGQQWEGTDVTAGIKLLQLIDRQPWRDQVKEIDVAGCLDDRPIKLRTTNDCTIVWGGAPGEEPALEMLAEGKLQRLSYLYQRSGRIDGNQAGELDITAEKLVVTR